MPTIASPQTAPINIRPKPEVRLSPTAVKRVESTLCQIISKKFDNLLKVTHLKDGRIDRDTWIVDSKNPEYLFGFRVILKDSILMVNHGINTWSQWAADLTRTELAHRLDGVLQLGEQLLSDEEPIDDLKTWMKKFAHQVQVDTLPQEFKRVAGIR